MVDAMSHLARQFFASPSLPPSSFSLFFFFLSPLSCSAAISPSPTALSSTLVRPRQTSASAVDVKVLRWTERCQTLRRSLRIHLVAASLSSVCPLFLAFILFFLAFGLAQHFVFSPSWSPAPTFLLARGRCVKLDPDDGESTSPLAPSPLSLRLARSCLRRPRACKVQKFESTYSLRAFATRSGSPLVAKRVVALSPTFLSA